MLKDNAIDKFVTVNGITYSYDTTRLKWLSIGRCRVDFSINHKNISSNRWMAVASGIYSNNVGYQVPKKGTITTITIKTKKETTVDFEIYENDDVIVTIQLINEIGKTVGLNTNFEEDASLKCFIKPLGNASYPLVSVHCASRL